MRTIYQPGVFACLLLASIAFYSCQKSEELSRPGNQEGSSQEFTFRNASTLEDGLLQAGGVTLTAPTTVNITESFSIQADVSCGRIAIERGYIPGPNNSRIYMNVTISSPGLLWEEIVAYQCYTADASWTGSLNEVGTYLYRTKHNASDGNCDGLGGSNTTGNCGFSGNQFYNFTIEAIDPCVTSFAGEAIACGNQREAVYHFTSVNDEDYIKIQGGLTNFTGADAVITVTGGNLTHSQVTPGSSSNRVIKIEGSVNGCEEITVRIIWNSTNNGGIITGEWSVKDENEVNIAAALAGLSCSDRK